MKRRSLRLLVLGGCIALIGCVAPAGSTQDPSTIEPAGTGSPPAASSPSIPAGVAERAFYTQVADGSFLIGDVAGTERIALPIAEVPVALAGESIATATFDVEGGTTDLRIHQLGASPSKPVQVPFIVQSAAFAGDGLIVAGGSKDRTVDPGVVAIDRATGSTAYLVTPGSRPPEWVGAVSSVTVSPSGDTLVVADCLTDRCQARLLGLRTDEAEGPIEIEGYVRLVSDSVLVQGGDPPTWISATDILSRRSLWSSRTAEWQAGYLTSDSLVQARVVGTDDRTFEVVRIDLYTGVETTLFSAPGNDGYVLWPELSTDETAVLGVGGRLQEIGGLTSEALLSTVDVATGAFDRASFTLSVGD